MRVKLDNDFGGWVMLFDSVTELADQAAASVKSGKWSATWAKRFQEQILFVGRHAKKGVMDAGRLLREPWPEAVALVEQVKRAAEQDAPEPESIKRKPRWVDTEGDISVDRVLGGEQDVYRTTTKKFVQGVPSITLLTNLDTLGGMDRTSGVVTMTKPKYDYLYVYDPPRYEIVGQEPYEVEWGTGMFWRSVACAAAVDILEAAGYTVDVWAWCNGWGVYKEHDKQFTAVRLKAAGQPLNLDAVCNATSFWFTYYALFASFAVAPEKLRGIGGLTPAFGKEIDHLDLGDTFVLPVRNLYTAAEAVKETARLIGQVKKYQAGEIACGEGFEDGTFAMY